MSMSGEILPARDALADRPDELEDGQRRRQGLAAGRGDDARQALAVDDALEEDAADDVAGRLDVDRPDLGHDVGGGGHLASLEDLDDLVPDLAVPCVENDRGRSQTGQAGGVVEDDPGVAAVGAAGEQDDVGIDGPEVGQVLGGELVGIGPDDLAAGRRRGHAGDREGQVRGQPDRRDLEAAAGRGRPVDGDRGGGGAARVAGQHGLADPVEAEAEVVDGRRHDLPAGGPELLPLQPEEASLGIGRSDVDREEERRGHRGPRQSLRLSRSCRNRSTTSVRSTWGPKTRSKPMALNFRSISSNGVLPTTRLPPT